MIFRKILTFTTISFIITSILVLVGSSTIYKFTYEIPVETFDIDKYEAFLDARRNITTLAILMYLFMWFGSSVAYLFIVTLFDDIKTMLN